MKFTFTQGLVMLLLMSASYAHDSKAQEYLNRRLSLNVENVEIKSVLAEIEKATEVRFVYSSQVINKAQRITLKQNQVSLASLLDKLFEPLQVRYELMGRKVILTKGSDREAPEMEGATGALLRLIKGRVLDESGIPLPGVSVVVKGSTLGTSTDVEGRFELELPTDASVLVFSFVGFRSEEVALGKASELDIMLRVENKALNEVVVVGYGTQRAKDLTGAVATLHQEVVKDLPVSSLDQKMIGQVAGVQIQQVSGAPGSGTSVRIRGSGSLGAGNEPLYVVDGMPYSAGLNQNLNPLMLINPNDIESISILKDASSTAIYGSRGSNGVVLITTKKGSFNKTQISFSAMSGVQTVPQRGRPDLMNQRQFAELQRNKIDIAVFRSEKRAATENDYPVEYRNLDNLNGSGTDWYDLILQSAPIHDYNVNVQKGGEDSRMNFSMGYFKQDGVLKHTGVERITSKVSMETTLKDKFTIGGTLQPTYIKQNRTNTNSNREDVIGIANWANPTMSPYDANGQLIPYIRSPQSKYHSAWSFANPLFVLQESKQIQEQFQNLGVAFIQWDILPGLVAKSSLNTIWSTSKYFQFTPSTVGGSNRPPVAGTGQASSNNGTSFNWLIENTLTYNKNFGDHRINALLGYTAQKSTSGAVNIDAGPYSNDLVQTINAAQGITNWDQNINEWSIISYLGRLNYGFQDKYLLTATLRSDGSSRFGSQNRFAYFPSVAGAWRLSEEEFLKNNSAIKDLKLRASFGTSGNNNIGNYSHLAQIHQGSYAFNNTQVAAAYVGLPNPYLTWEESSQIDAGLDLELFQNNLSLTLDFYSRKSKNMLLNDVIPAITGFSNQIVNKGNVRNRGVELTLGASPISGPFNWDVNLNVAINRNKVLSLNDNSDRILSGSNDGNPTHVSVVGKPIGQFFGFELEGVYTAADVANPDIIKTTQVYEGNPKYKDVNGDGVVNDLLDYTIIGNPHPNFTFGFTNNFSYKRFSVGLIVNGQQGGQVMNGLRQTVDNLQGFFNVRQAWVNRWVSPEQPGDGMHSGVPKLTPSWGHRVNSLWVEDASFIRIANVSLGYTLPDAWVKKSGFINGCRIYATVQNLAMFTAYEGANPEGQSRNINNTLSPGFDMSSYPLARTTSFGLNLSF
ncbi:TonB-dependent receptor [Dyadobacter tibetensis]|uniref:TonB-dependent receptor n=1 Tax=Dyadobacter tibetensis TaxID=1211851 RepID=UPI0004726222|nr:TonB-dependent receptor [Dyadobacter tibetensis]